MASYSIIATDNNRYGPVDDNGLLTWAREGRVAEGTMVYCHDTNVTMPARSVAVLQQLFAAPTPGAAAAMQSGAAQGFAPQSPPPGAPTGPQPMNYQAPYGPVFANGHELSDFPVVGVVLLEIFVPIFSWIWFNLMHGKMNTTRPDDPSAGKAIGFSFIPFFNIWYWSFFTYKRLVLRINEQRVAHGLPPANLDNAATTYCVLLACLFPVGCIPFLNILLMLGIKVAGCIFFAQTQQAVNELVMVTRQRAMNQQAMSR